MPASRGARRRVVALTGLPPIAPDRRAWWEQMCVAPLPLQPGMTVEELHARLWNEFQVEVPITDWQEWRFVRVSIQAYNTERDVARLVKGLATMLAVS